MAVLEKRDKVDYKTLGPSKILALFWCVEEFKGIHFKKIKI